MGIVVDGFHNVPLFFRHVQSSDDIKVSKSFNYTDINERMMRSISSKSEMCRKSKTNQVLDDVCALELHRSKTYIIDLIDKALSRELGTIPAKNLNEVNIIHTQFNADQLFFLIRFSV